MRVGGGVGSVASVLGAGGGGADSHGPQRTPHREQSVISGCTGQAQGMASMLRVHKRGGRNEANRRIMLV